MIIAKDLPVLGSALLLVSELEAAVVVGIAEAPVLDGNSPSVAAADPKSVLSKAQMFLIPCRTLGRSAEPRTSV